MKAITELGISPTPWHVSQGQSSDDMWCEVRGKEVGDIVCDCMIGHGYEQIRANARLIAAAPDCLMSLCETLTALKNRLPSQPTVNELEIIDRAEAAIRKATGESEEGGAK